jgi:hypothetical protein
MLFFCRAQEEQETEDFSQPSWPSPPDPESNGFAREDWLGIAGFGAIVKRDARKKKLWNEYCQKYDELEEEYFAKRQKLEEEISNDSILMGQY